MFSKLVCVSASAPLVQSVLVLMNKTQSLEGPGAMEKHSTQSDSPSDGMDEFITQKFGKAFDPILWNFNAHQQDHQQLGQKVSQVIEDGKAVWNKAIEAGETAMHESETQYQEYIQPQKGSLDDKNIQFAEFPQFLKAIEQYKGKNLPAPQPLENKSKYVHIKTDVNVRSKMIFADLAYKNVKDMEYYYADADNFFAVQMWMATHKNGDLDAIKTSLDIIWENPETPGKGTGVCGDVGHAIRRKAFQAILNDPIEDGLEEYAGFRSQSGFKFSKFIEIVVFDFYLPYFNAIWNEAGMAYTDYAGKIFLHLAFKDLREALQDVDVKYPHAFAK
jgi:hypothetical protein